MRVKVKPIQPTPVLSGIDAKRMEVTSGPLGQKLLFCHDNCKTIVTKRTEHAMDI